MTFFLFVFHFCVQAYAKDIFVIDVFQSKLDLPREEIGILSNKCNQVIEQSIGPNESIEVVYGAELQKRLKANGLEVNACQGLCGTDQINRLNANYGVFPKIESRGDNTFEISIQLVGEAQNNVSSVTTFARRLDITERLCKKIVEEFTQYRIQPPKGKSDYSSESLGLGLNSTTDTSRTVPFSLLLQLLQFVLH